VNELPVFCCQTALNAEIAKQVMGRKNVHRQDRLTYIGKKQDKLGHWRTAKV
jgi:hypothetical protein